MAILCCVAQKAASAAHSRNYNALSLLQKTVQIRDQFFLYMDLGDIALGRFITSTFWAGTFYSCIPASAPSKVRSFSLDTV